MTGWDWDKLTYGPPDVEFARFNSRRSVVYSAKGIVSSTQPLASAAGLEILKAGGNAVDAAVATAAALNVTEPSCTGIGGDAFCLYYNAKDKTVKGMNASGRAPKALTIEHLRSRGITGNAIPLTDLNSVTVPGAAAGWVDATAAFGTMKLADVLAPAIRLAEEGVPVSELHASGWKRSENLIKNASPDAHAMLLNGRAPRAGEIMTFPDLARTFREVVEKGKDGFYKGRVAEEIVKLIKAKGGVMELEDLAAHETTMVEPISYTYGGEDGVTVYECPPNGGGITALLALGILDAMQESGKIPNVLTLPHNGPEYLHALVEALRLAFADSRYYVADPEFEHVPVKELLSKEYLRKRAELFDATKQNPVIKHGYPANSSDTVYLSVTDQWGNACSYIQSNYAGFGTGAIPHGCGFTLQNRGSNFVLEKGHPNELKGGKRPYHTIIPAMALRGDKLFLCYGVMGGFMQPQGHVQVLLNALRGYTMQAAMDAPRFCISSGSPDSGVKGRGDVGDVNSDVYFEEGISDETVEKLREMGHDARRVTGFGRGMLGRGQIIQRLTDQTTGRLVWAAGSDQRGDGQAVAQF
ncbi:gamma-glutamyltranspeptidase [Calocera cornea HHB12733]|uniref:Gamma-glutamyltranspeptidase n=1 Tax=Calocera cornea HHB12733 TaxID=1353952 RepID=A0A165JQB9_9BASI|nr:gamma-glutamyltranspeptidase [Calocera cornea HHB12733]